jgi:hypothetical protein
MLVFKQLFTFFKAHCSIDYAPTNLSSEEVAVYAGNDVLMQVLEISALTVGDQHGILALQFRNHLIHLLLIILA